MTGLLVTLMLHAGCGGGTVAGFTAEQGRKNTRLGLPVDCAELLTEVSGRLAFLDV
jgi:hypothetical protein